MALPYCPRCCKCVAMSLREAARQRVCQDCHGPLFRTHTRRPKSRKQLAKRLAQVVEETPAPEPSEPVAPPIAELVPTAPLVSVQPAEPDAPPVPGPVPAPQSAVLPPIEVPSDGQLLWRFVHEGSEPAFAILVRRYGPLVFGACRRVLQDDHDAEDAFQATFLVLMRKAPSLDGTGSLANWLYTVAHHAALKARARSGRRSAREKPVAVLPEAASPPGPQWDDLSPLLDEELQRLPTQLRAPLILCYFSGRSQEEAARELGCSKDTVRGRLARGRDILRDRLARRGIVFSSVALAALLAERPLQAAVPAHCLSQAGTASTGGTASALAQAVIRGVALGKMKLAGAVLLAIGVTGFGAGILSGGIPLRLPQREPEVTYGDVVYAPAGPPKAPMTSEFEPVSTDKVPKVFPERGGNGKPFAFGPGPGANFTTNQVTGKRGSQLPIKAYGLWSRGLPGSWGGDYQVDDYVLRPHWCLAFSPDSRKLAVGGENGSVDLFEFDTEWRHKSLGKLKDRPSSLAFTPDGQWIVAACADSAIHLVSASEDRVQDVPLPTTVFKIALLKDGRSLVCLEGTVLETRVVLRDLFTGNPLPQWAARPARFFALAPRGDRLALWSENGPPTAWDLRTGKPLGPELLPPRKIAVRGERAGPADYAGTFTPDGNRLVSVALDGTVRFTEIATGRETLQFRGTSAFVSFTAISPDGRQMMYGGLEPGLHGWDVLTGKENFRHQEANWFLDGQFSPDGKWFAVAGFQKVLIWNTADLPGASLD